MYKFNLPDVCSLISARAKTDQALQGGKFLLDFFSIPLVAQKFSTAPASSAHRFHHAYEGGLMDHSMEVYQLAADQRQSLNVWRQRNNLPPVNFSEFDVLTAALLHDMHKLCDGNGRDFYIPYFVKSGARSAAEPYQTNDAFCKLGADVTAHTVSPATAQAAFILDHSKDYFPDGLLSLSVVRAFSGGLFSSLKPDVVQAIRYHDLAFGPGKYELAGGKESDLLMIIHGADMLSSRLSGRLYREAK